MANDSFTYKEQLYSIAGGYGINLPEDKAEADRLLTAIHYCFEKMRDLGVNEMESVAKKQSTLERVVNSYDTSMLQADLYYTVLHEFGDYFGREGRLDKAGMQDYDRLCVMTGRLHTDLSRAIEEDNLDVSSEMLVSEDWLEQRYGRDVVVDYEAEKTMEMKNEFYYKGVQDKYIEPDESILPGTIRIGATMEFNVALAMNEVFSDIRNRVDKIDEVKAKLAEGMENVSGAFDKQSIGAVAYAYYLARGLSAADIAEGAVNPDANSNYVAISREFKEAAASTSTERAAEVYAAILTHVSDNKDALLNAMQDLSSMKKNTAVPGGLAGIAACIKSAYDNEAIRASMNMEPAAAEDALVKLALCDDFKAMTENEAFARGERLDMENCNKIMAGAVATCYSLVKYGNSVSEGRRYDEFKHDIQAYTKELELSSPDRECYEKYYLPAYSDKNARERKSRMEEFSEMPGRYRDSEYRNLVIEEFNSKINRPRSGAFECLDNEFEEFNYVRNGFNTQEFGRMERTINDVIKMRKSIDKGEFDLSNPNNKAKWDKMLKNLEESTANYKRMKVNDVRATDKAQRRYDMATKFGILAAELKAHVDVYIKDSVLKAEIKLENDKKKALEAEKAGKSLSGNASKPRMRRELLDIDELQNEELESKNKVVGKTHSKNNELKTPELNNKEKSR